MDYIEAGNHMILILAHSGIAPRVGVKQGRADGADVQSLVWSGVPKDDSG